MLTVIRQKIDLKFGDILHIYAESISFDAKREYPYLSEQNGVLEAEQNFRRYLFDFLSETDSFVALWESQGRFVAALRVEPYRDGYLIEGLETAAECRRRGYAENLLKASLLEVRKFFSGPIYSHIAKDNLASIRVHGKCGFQFLSDMAVYIDGSADYRCNTYCYL